MTTQEIQDKIRIAQAEIAEAQHRKADAEESISNQMRYYTGCDKKLTEKNRNSCRADEMAKMTPYKGVVTAQAAIIADRTALLATYNKELLNASEADKTVKTTLAEQGKTMESVATAAQADAVVTVQKSAADIKNDNKKKNAKLILGFSAGAIVLVVAVILIIRKLRKKKQQ